MAAVAAAAMVVVAWEVAVMVVVELEEAAKEVVAKGEEEKVEVGSVVVAMEEDWEVAG